LPLGQSGAGDEAVAASLCATVQDADPGYPWRARLPRSGHAGAAVLQHAALARRRRTAGVFSRRESLDPEAAELAALVPRILRLDQALRAGRAGAIIPERCPYEQAGMPRLQQRVPGPAEPSLELLLAGDATLRRRLRVQARPADRLAAIAAGAIAALFDAGERHVNLGELGHIACHCGNVEVGEDVRQHPVLGRSELVHESGHPRV